VQAVQTPSSKTARFVSQSPLFAASSTHEKILSHTQELALFHTFPAIKVPTCSNRGTYVLFPLGVAWLHVQSFRGGILVYTEYANRILSFLLSLCLNMHLYIYT